MGRRKERPDLGSDPVFFSLKGIRQLFSFNEMLNPLLFRRKLFKECFFETTKGNVRTSAFPLCHTVSDVTDIILPLCSCSWNKMSLNAMKKKSV